MSETPLQRLASHLLGEPVGPWIRARRPERKSWRAIASELEQATGGQIKVPFQTLINWAPDPPTTDDGSDATEPAEAAS
ncbi:hypothetical protein [Pseudonocardia sp. WMMC193]|uniref:hypothetical protein n=1 Tax=Pseudonocardia sp. WMMC193 TaxID=2911965 RepID=UPI001F311A5E|nr:hypothetical protein [Pseudonocardia sp. WMMC193]MCF7551011.1 hypothetical protein [Pseudonocardia sp. WMMC193]